MIHPWRKLMNQQDPVRNYLLAKVRRDQLLEALNAFADRLEAISDQIRQDPARMTPTGGNRWGADSGDLAHPPPDWTELDALLKSYQHANADFRRAMEGLPASDQVILGLK
jgi:hypothetical protein